MNKTREQRTFLRNSLVGGKHTRGSERCRISWVCGLRETNQLVIWGEYETGVFGGVGGGRGDWEGVRRKRKRRGWGRKERVGEELEGGERNWGIMKRCERQ